MTSNCYSTTFCSCHPNQPPTLGQEWRQAALDKAQNTAPVQKTTKATAMPSLFSRRTYGTREFLHRMTRPWPRSSKMDKVLTSISPCPATTAVKWQQLWIFRPKVPKRLTQSRIVRHRPQTLHVRRVLSCALQPPHSTQHLRSI